MKLIETYKSGGEGYDPFLIRKNWQVAWLNYLPGHGLDDINDIEAHNQTDEVFILYEGTAILIAAEVIGNDITFETIRMKTGVAYNIPAGAWHNIAMDTDARMIIVENAETHLKDCTYMNLTTQQKQDLYAQLKVLIENN